MFRCLPPKPTPTLRQIIRRGFWRWSAITRQSTLVIYLGGMPPFQPALPRLAMRTNREQRKKVKSMNQLIEVAPVKPVAPYIGGKIRLAKKIIEKINKVQHECYAEPFVGMGGIFLRRTLRPKVEIINDISSDVVNLFRILRHHYLPFMEMLKFQITSRDEWDKLLALEPSSLTDLQRAARFLYLQKVAFGGKVTEQHFGMPSGRSGRFDITKLGVLLEDVHERLAGVTIEKMNWQRFILRYDREGMLFYLDPPYYGCENDYGENIFSREDFSLMAELLANIKGRFILSINDHPVIRETFKAFNIEAVDVAYSLGKIDNGKRFGELIISN